MCLCAPGVQVFSELFAAFNISRYILIMLIISLARKIAKSTKPKIKKSKDHQKPQNLKSKKHH